MHAMAHRLGPASMLLGLVFGTGCLTRIMVALGSSAGWPRHQAGQCGMSQWSTRRQTDALQCTGDSAVASQWAKSL